MEDINELQHDFTSILRKIGTVVAFILMLTALLLLVWLMRTTYLSLVNYDTSLVRIISGRVFICGFKYPAGPIKRWYSLVVLFLAIVIPYTVLARCLSHRKTRLAYWSFVIPTTILYLYLLLILTLPFSWLIQYINTMGFTPRRIYALFYGLGGYIIILTFLYWVIRKPKTQRKPRNGIINEANPYNVHNEHPQFIKTSCV